jgi:hypothetical protein
MLSEGNFADGIGVAVALGVALARFLCFAV